MRITLLVAVPLLFACGAEPMPPPPAIAPSAQPTAASSAPPAPRMPDLMICAQGGDPSTRTHCFALSRSCEGGLTAGVFPALTPCTAKLDESACRAFEQRLEQEASRLRAAAFPLERAPKPAHHAHFMMVDGNVLHGDETTRDLWKDGSRRCY